MNRRDFLKGMLIASCVGLAGLPKLGGVEEAEASWRVPKLPWGYKELDPDEALRRGHLGYMIGE
ncbi:MAG: twin-arginine translocation signal domain-containing protein [Thermodesulfobacteria bacterium]|nr:twin-arginine translocation signal domain-containing protein [Thermodesulfobacteriota bacterium]